MKTKSTVLALVIAVFLPVVAVAQYGQCSPEKREKIESIKVGYLTQKLSLTTEEAQAFWPVYNEYRKVKGELRDEKSKTYRTYQSDFENLSDDELTKMADNKIIYEQKELDLKKKYHAEFKNVLPAKKVALLYQAEYDFKKHLLKEAQNREAQQKHKSY